MAVLNNPAWDARSVTPDDSNNLPIDPTRAVYVGGTGDIKVTFTKGGASVTFSSVPAGTVLPIQVARIWSTGTTATNILALY